MNIELGLPNINGATEREQLSQIRSYLYRLIPELQFALRSHNAAYTGSAAGKDDALPSASWHSLGLSDKVSAAATACGTLGRSDCAYFVRETEGSVRIVFSCAFSYAGEPVRVNAKALPKSYRPRANVYALCPAEQGIACVCVTPEGEIRIEWAQGTPDGHSAFAWIDGAAEFFR